MMQPGRPAGGTLAMQRLWVCGHSDDVRTGSDDTTEPSVHDDARTNKMARGPVRAYH